MKQIQKEKVAESSKRTGSAKQMALEDIVAKITEGDMDGAETETDYWSEPETCKESSQWGQPKFWWRPEFIWCSKGSLSKPQIRRTSTTFTKSITGTSTTIQIMC